LEQKEAKVLTEKDLKHVVMCLHHIWKWYEEGRPLGGFLMAVLRNNLIEACRQADDINEKIITLYPKFIYEYIPVDYKKKLKA